MQAYSPPLPDKNILVNENAIFQNLTNENHHLVVGPHFAFGTPTTQKAGRPLRNLCNSDKRPSKASARLADMSAWTKLKVAVDASAQKFLANKRFSREKKEFPWDWHVWNLLLVSTPSLVWWAYLHRVEQVMIEEQRVREATPGRTGVGGSTYMVPGGEGGQMVGAGGNDVTLQRFLSHQKKLHTRLDAIETTLGLEVDPSLRIPDRIENAEESLEGRDGEGQDISILQKMSGAASKAMEAANKAVEVATIARKWVANVAVPEGKRLYHKARDWLADDEKNNGNDSRSSGEEADADNTGNDSGESANRTDRQDTPSGNGNVGEGRKDGTESSESGKIATAGGKDTVGSAFRHRRLDDKSQR